MGARLLRRLASSFLASLLSLRLAPAPCPSCLEPAAGAPASGRLCVGQAGCAAAGRLLWPGSGGGRLLCQALSAHLGGAKAGAGSPMPGCGSGRLVISSWPLPARRQAVSKSSSTQVC